MRAADAFSTAVALVAGLLVSALVILMAGANPLPAFAALADGAFGSADALAEVGVKSCPLILCGLAMAVAFRTGIWNIGAEGQLLLGALAAAAAGSRAAGLPAPLAIAGCLLLAGMAGGGWAWIAGALRVGRGVSEVIGTIMLNFVAVALVSYMVQGPLMEASGRYPQTDAIAAAVRLPRLPPTRLHAGVGVALLALASTALALRRTVWGFEVRAVGVNARAARIAGIAVESRLLSAFLLSGAIAGLAGGIEVIGVTYRLYERFSPGYGFTGIAVALLGRLQPAGVLLAGVFFGILETGSNAMERSAGVSSVLVSVIQAAIIMSLIALEGRRWFSRAANASGNDAAPETRTSPHGSSEARR